MLLALQPDAEVAKDGGSDYRVSYPEDFLAVNASLNTQVRNSVQTCNRRRVRADVQRTEHSAHYPTVTFHGLISKLSAELAAEVRRRETWGARRWLAERLVSLGGPMADFAWCRGYHGRLDHPLYGANDMAQRWKDTVDAKGECGPKGPSVARGPCVFPVGCMAVEIES